LAAYWVEKKENLVQREEKKEKERSYRDKKNRKQMEKQLQVGCIVGLPDGCEVGRKVGS
jgi:hypothetical protein